MNKTTRTILITLLVLIISLVSLLLLPSIPYDDFEMSCTARCQHTKDNTAWNDCMLQCHGGNQ